MHHNADHQADLSKKETIRLTNNGRDGQLQHGLPDWLYEGDHYDHNLIMMMTMIMMMIMVMIMMMSILLINSNLIFDSFFSSR